MIIKSNSLSSSQWLNIPSCNSILVFTHIKIAHLSCLMPCCLHLTFKVLSLWIMDQVPLGHKTPRPGHARLVHCPACRGLQETPAVLTTGHVLLECMAVEGGWKPLLKFEALIQGPEWEKGYAPSLTTATPLAGAVHLLTTCLSMEWMLLATNCRTWCISREVEASPGWPTCGSVPGARRRTSF